MINFWASFIGFFGCRADIERLEKNSGHIPPKPALLEASRAKSVSYKISNM